jgi:hypothetical protein
VTGVDVVERISMETDGDVMAPAANGEMEAGMGTRISHGHAIDGSTETGGFEEADVALEEEVVSLTHPGTGMDVAAGGATAWVGAIK